MSAWLVPSFVERWHLQIIAGTASEMSCAKSVPPDLCLRSASNAEDPPNARLHPYWTRSAGSANNLHTKLHQVVDDSGQLLRCCGEAVLISRLHLRQLCLAKKIKKLNLRVLTPGSSALTLSKRDLSASSLLMEACTSGMALRGGA